MNKRLQRIVAGVMAFMMLFANAVFAVESNGKIEKSTGRTIITCWGVDNNFLPDLENYDPDDAEAAERYDRSTKMTCYKYTFEVGEEREYEFTVYNDLIYDGDNPVYDENGQKRHTGLRYVYEDDTIPVSDIEVTTANAFQSTVRMRLIPGKEYTIYFSSEIADDIEFRADDFYEDDDDMKPEWYEKLFAFLVIYYGFIFQSLISIILGSDLSIDALVFDRFSDATLTLFKNDVGYYSYKGQSTVNELFYTRW